MVGELYTLSYGAIASMGGCEIWDWGQVYLGKAAAPISQHEGFVRIRPGCARLPHLLVHVRTRMGEDQLLQAAALAGKCWDLVK